MLELTKVSCFVCTAPATLTLTQPYASTTPSPCGTRSTWKDLPGLNKSLFSQHYLETRLPALPTWAADVQLHFKQVQALWQRAQHFGPTWNEAQTEAELVKPLLDLLGWHTIVQAKSTHGGQLSRPDYALFLDEATRDVAYGLQGQDDPFYHQVTIVAEAKRWNRPLSQKTQDNRDSWKANSNPSHQMVSYLVGTRVAWGILTNGNEWRLYSREVSSVASEYYSIDLGAIFADLPAADTAQPALTPLLTQGQLDQFKRWWLFFRRTAFAPDSHGRAFVAAVHEGSNNYAREISDKLKEIVFDEVMPEIAGGFVAWRHQQLGIKAEQPADLQRVYRASLSLLYKLLFLLYGEARNLLPMQNVGYAYESLTRMAERFATWRDEGRPISRATHATREYDHLLALFHRIDRGDPDLGIPRYNGGLFNPTTADNEFLETHKLSDYAVAATVDLLVRDRGEPVDYAFISVRNLGSIYEGLLENRLQVLDANLGQVALVNDKGERKASGSYYTPDYIVEYIVQQTLGPMLEIRHVQFTAAMATVVELRQTLQSNAAAQHDHNQRLRAELEIANRRARETFLGIKVCDPAMGSGHFLVNAVDYLTDNIIERMQRYHDTHPAVPLTWNPIHGLIERVRREILDEMRGQGIKIDAALLDDTALLTRLVMKRCVYGVDLNQMAVELAKLSLWLHSFTVGAPLSFLDHHLRWGNSLIGADVQTVEAALITTKQSGSISKAAQRLAAGRGEKARSAVVAQQFNLFGGPFAGLLDLTDIMLQIVEMGDATLADVHASARLYQQFQAELTPYKQALDLWVSRHFGNTAADEFLEAYPLDVLPALRSQRKLAKKHQKAIDDARMLWQEKRFFHWDLEFPEVFIDLAQRDWAANPGFDAVIGNPPYVRQEGLTPLKPYLATAFPHLQHGVADLFVYFFGQALQLLQAAGRTAYISSNSWLRANYATPLRAYLRQEAIIETIIDLGDNRVFADAPDLYPAIHVVRRGLPAAEQAAQVAVFNRGEGVANFAAQVAAKLFTVAIHDQADSGWQLEDQESRRLFQKLIQGGQALGEVVKSQIYYGVKTGLNEAFIVDQATRDRLVKLDPAGAQLIKPLLRGEDLRPWYQENEGRWLIVLPSGWTAKTFGNGLTEAAAWQQFSTAYHAIAAHLHPFIERACQRQDKGEYWWELRSCDYYDAFDMPKIFWPELAKQPRFSWDTSGLYINNKGYIMPAEHPWLLGLLNSRVIWFVIMRTCLGLGERAGMERFQLFAQYISQLPIPDVSSVERETIGSAALAITELAKARYDLHQRVRNRLQVDWGTPAAKLNQKLTAWWALDFTALRGELKKVFRQDIPLKERDEWEGWFAAQRQAHQQLTEQIVQLERQVNAAVYATFGLTPAEIRLVEERTKYEYGVV